ncbi:MAG: alpha/beta hydrolase [Deltaproteobacteria bacterium]
MERFLRSSIRSYYELELPTASRRRKRWPLLVAMHGYEGDKDSMMRLARRIVDGRMIVISLQGPNQLFVRRGSAEPVSYRVGFGWGTTYKMQESVVLHHHNLRRLITLAAEKYHADRRRVFLLAFSQPCAYNYRFIFTHPREIHGAIAVCGGVPGDWKENRDYKSARTHVLHIAANNDEWYTREKNLQFRRELSQRAASLDFRFYNSTHRFPRSSIPHIRKWIAKHL